MESILKSREKASVRTAGVKAYNPESTGNFEMAVNSSGGIKMWGSWRGS